MSNSNIAINWAISSVNSPAGIVMSDRFFSHFKAKEIKLIKAKLAKLNIETWSIPGNDTGGVFMFKSTDSRVNIVTNGSQSVATWLAFSGNVMVLVKG